MALARTCAQGACSPVTVGLAGELTRTDGVIGIGLVEVALDERRVDRLGEHRVHADADGTQSTWIERGNTSTAPFDAE